ncbi:PBP/GOBP family [Popillia japonica]|uniref:PBP/GOBP family n=1 Tax=Popillia japonica TaxID=7064 RepID=A0AAW1IE01_POPJA
MVIKGLLWIFFLIGITECRPSIEHSQDVSKITTDCSQQTRMDIDTLKNILKTGKMPEKSQTYLNYLECLYKQQNYFDEKGFVAYSTIENYLSTLYDSSGLRKAIQPCENVQVCVAIWNILKEEYLHFPNTVKEWRRISDEFLNRWNIPNTVAAMDGKHICFIPPRSEGSRR